MARRMEWQHAQVAGMQEVVVIAKLSSLTSLYSTDYNFSYRGPNDAVPVALEGKYGFDSIAYMIAAGERTECELDWEWLYGELPAGEYRVEKAVHDFRGTGDFDEYTVYEHFVLN